MSADAVISGGCVVVTGAAQGIGAAVASAFLDAGFAVAMLDRSAEVATTAAALDRGRGKALPLEVTVDDEKAFAAAFAAAAERFGRVAVMVNNAARTTMRSVWDIDADDWDAVLRTNLRGTFFGCRIAGKHMRAMGQGGRIINMASIAGQRGGTATGADYAASKAGILVLTKVFAQELAADGITVNAIAPAAIDGPMVASLAPEKRAGLEKSIPVGRFGLDGEVAAAALYLARPEAAFVTGATLDINGGLFMR
jgi:3-oxoacyl-[acyl-carrier protein] reductase